MLATPIVLLATDARTSHSYTAHPAPDGAMSWTVIQQEQGTWQIAAEKWRLTADVPRGKLFLRYVSVSTNTYVLGRDIPTLRSIIYLPSPVFDLSSSWFLRHSLGAYSVEQNTTIRLTNCHHHDDQVRDPKQEWPDASTEGCLALAIPYWKTGYAVDNRLGLFAHT